MFHKASFAQSEDSLRNIIKGKYHDTIKLKTSSALTQMYWNKDLKFALRQAKYTLAIAVRAKNDLLLSQATNDLAGTYYFLGDYHNALLYNKRTLKTRQKVLPNGKTVGSKKAIAAAYNNIASLYLTLGEYDKAIENNLNSLKAKEEIGDSLGIARSLTNIGNSYESMNNYTMALKFQKEAFEMMKLLKNEHGIGASYNNLGNVYLKIKQYAKSRVCFENSIVIRKKLGDLQNLAGSYNNLGELFFMQDDYVSAKKNFEEALALVENSSDTYTKAALLINLAETYRRTDNHQKALEFFKMGIENAQKAGLLDLEMSAYDGMAKMYSSKKEYEKAYQYLKKYTALNDSIFKTENSKRVAELQAKYDDAHKSKEIESLRKEKVLSELQASRKELELQKQKNIKYLFIAGSLLLFVSGGFVYSRYRLKNKINHQLEFQNHQIAEKNKDITNSILYAKRIQEAIFPTKEMVNRLIPNSFILYKPKDIVSGDFYFIDEKNGLQFFAVVDCTGHGVPGALVSVVGFNGLNRCLNEFNLWKPNEILEKLSRIVNETFRQTYEESKVKDGMDISLCAIDRNKNKLYFAGANNPMWLIRKTGEQWELQEVKADKQPVGAFIGDVQQPFTFHEIDLKKGDRLYLFTDGFADQFGGPKGKKYKYHQQANKFLELALTPIRDQSEILNKAFEDWRGDLEQIDDVCIVGIEI